MLGHFLPLSQIMNRLRGVKMASEPSSKAGLGEMMTKLFAVGDFFASQKVISLSRWNE